MFALGFYMFALVFLRSSLGMSKILFLVVSRCSSAETMFKICFFLSSGSN